MSSDTALGRCALCGEDLVLEQSPQLQFGMLQPEPYMAWGADSVRRDGRLGLPPARARYRLMRALPRL